MEYMDKDELRKLFSVVYDYTRDKRKNRTGVDYHLGMVCALWHGMRVSELIELTGNDIDVTKRTLTDRRKKKSLKTTQPIKVAIDKLFDETPVIALAIEKKGDKLFPVSRQSFDNFIKDCGKAAGIHHDKLHMHALKHSIAMMIWEENHSLGKIQTYLGHKSPASTMAYLRVIDATEVNAEVASICI
jgi:integrase/recombinase XerD